MASTEQLIEQQKCVPHGTPTLLRCASCDTPVCPKCGRLTEVGQKCLGCAPLRRGRSRRSRVTSGVMAVAAIGFLAAGIWYVGSDSFQKSGTTPVAPRKPVAAVGAEVADEGLAFRVQKLECADRQLEFEGETASPQGQFCFLSVNVRNDRRSDAVFAGDEQYLIDSAGRRYDMDLKATLINTPPGEEESEFEIFLVREISPGEVVSGVLVYDVPTRARIVEAEFHGVVLGGPGIAYPSARGAKVMVRPVIAPSAVSRPPFPLDTPIPVVDPSTSLPVSSLPVSSNPNPETTGPPRTFAPAPTTSTTTSGSVRTFPPAD